MFVSPEPDEQFVRKQLGSILASKAFRTVPRQRQFLEYVVEETLQGRKDGIKEYSIGLAVFERGSGWDLKPDNIVRNEASRLRRTLDGYYGKEGEADPVRIEIPTGGYVPTFSWKALITITPVIPPPPQPPIDPTPEAEFQKTHGIFGRRMILGATLLAIIMVCGSLAWKRYRANATARALVYFEDAKVLINAHKPNATASALQKLQEAIRLDPELAPAHALLSQLYLFTRDDVDSSFKHACLALKYNSLHYDWDVDARATTLLGTLNRGRGHSQAALLSFNRALSLSEEHHDIRGMIAAHNNRGLVYPFIGNHADALAEFRIAIDLSRSLKDPIAEARSLRFMAGYYHHLGQPKEALNMYREALVANAGKDPSDEASLILAIGSFYYDAKQFQEAEREFRRVLRVVGATPHDLANAHNSIGNLYKSKQQWDDALEEFTIALRMYRETKTDTAANFFSTPDQRNKLTLRRNDINVLLSMQDVCYKKKDHIGAITYLSEILQIDPSLPNQRYDLACNYCLAGDPSMALREFQKVTLDPMLAKNAETDPDLQCIRNTATVKEMIRAAKASTAESAVVSGSLPPLTCKE